MAFLLRPMMIHKDQLHHMPRYIMHGIIPAKVTTPLCAKRYPKVRHTSKYGRQIPKRVVRNQTRGRRMPDSPRTPSNQLEDLTLGFTALSAPNFNGHTSAYSPARAVCNVSFNHVQSLTETSFSGNLGSPRHRVWPRGASCFYRYRKAQSSPSLLGHLHFRRSTPHFNSIEFH